MKKWWMLLWLLLALPAGAGERVAAVWFAVPEGARYRTTEANGEVNFWAAKPFLVVTDAALGQVPARFWTDGQASLLQIVGGVKPRGERWQRSLRRVR